MISEFKITLKIINRCITCCHVTVDENRRIATNLTIGIDRVVSRLCTGIRSFQLKAGPRQEIASGYITLPSNVA